jgi:hypothetical protein
MQWSSGIVGAMPVQFHGGAEVNSLCPVVVFNDL